MNINAIEISCTKLNPLFTIGSSNSSSHSFIKDIFPQILSQLSYRDYHSIYLQVRIGIVSR